MASANSYKLKMVVPVATCIVLVLLSMGPPAMAGVEEDCAVICRPACDGFTSEVCMGLNGTFPVLNSLDFFYTTCKVRISALCRSLCFSVCTLDTLTPPPGAPSPAPSGAAAPPACNKP
jgi:hypothetical protein